MKPSTPPNPEAPLADKLLRVLFKGGTARAHLVQLDRSWLEVAHRHNEPPEVMRLLGEMSCASILLSGSLKYEGSVILQIHGDGPVRLAVAECDAAMGFRSTVTMSESLEVPAGADWKALVNQNNQGRFSVVLDPKIQGQQPYQGIVPLHEEGVAPAIESYMNRSEQLPTYLWLACDGDRAAGLLLQKMPNDGGNVSSQELSETQEQWEKLITLAKTVTDLELLHTDPETLLHRLFWEEEPRLLENKPVQFFCSCSRTRVGKMLVTLGLEEVESILEEQGAVQVNCDFCNTSYVFDPVDCAELFVGPTPAAGSPTSSTVH